MTLRLKANRRFPSIPVVVDDARNHTQVLMAVKEALDIGQRRTGDLLNSFIRVEDLIDLGLITIEGNTNAIVGADLSEIADIGDLSGAAAGDFLRFDGGEWINDDLHVGDITQTMVTQHQAALAINWSQLVGTAPTITRGATFTTGEPGEPVTTPVNDVMVRIPFAATITKVSVLTQGGPGDCVIDIWSDTFGVFPPTVGDSITASAKPTISSGVKYEDSTLTDWDTNVAAGDVLLFHLESATTFDTIFVILELTPT